jgi:hypothetical protein
LYSCRVCWLHHLHEEVPEQPLYGAQSSNLLLTNPRYYGEDAEAGVEPIVGVSAEAPGHKDERDLGACGLVLQEVFPAEIIVRE